MATTDLQPTRQQEVTRALLEGLPDADPIKQLLYATLHARMTLDRIDRSIKRDLHRGPKQTINGTTVKAPDPLHATPQGQYLARQQLEVRRQLGYLAKQYIALGIEERQTRVIEDWSQILLPFIQQVIDDPDLALSRRQRERMPMVVERHLRALERPA